MKKKILSILMTVMVASSLTAFAASDDAENWDHYPCYREDCPYHNGDSYCDGTGQGYGHCGGRHHRGR